MPKLINTRLGFLVFGLFMSSDWDSGCEEIGMLLVDGTNYNRQTIGSLDCFSYTSLYDPIFLPLSYVCNDMYSKSPS
jgi:hypothetical protein